MRHLLDSFGVLYTKFVAEAVSPIIDTKGRRQIDALQYVDYPTSILRRLQSYAVNIYEHEYEALQSKGVIQTIADSYHVLDPSRMDTYYHPRTGLVIPERSGGDALFFE